MLGSRQFDYSGSQCLKALKEEGIRSILVNPNIATIQTDKRMADRIFFLPVTPEFVARVIESERPDGILLGFGGQTALNCGVKLAEQGMLEKYGVNVLGTPVRGIEITEDRQLFKQAMVEAGIDVPSSEAAYSVEDARRIAGSLGYPVITRVAYTLGGRGGGVARNEEELTSIAQRGLNLSMRHQILVEEYIGHWKQIEYEIMRDSHENSMIVCNMENVLSMRVHTGDNIVVAPSQTITNGEYHLLRTAAINAASRCGVVGECNMQFALEPSSEEYRAIEINARLSRSSALASKATGYPIAYIATKLCLGHSLTELKNKVTGVTTSLFEPSLDYLVVKMPRWDTKKFEGASRSIGTSMKSVGEVMAIGRTFEEAVQKAARMLNLRYDGVIRRLVETDDPEELRSRLENPTDQVIFDIVEALHAGIPKEEVSKLSVVDPWFIEKLLNIVRMHARLLGRRVGGLERDPETMRQAKKLGFSDKQIAGAVGVEEEDIRSLRERMRVRPFTKVVDTLAAEWPARTNYLYETYNGSVEEAKPSAKRKVIVLGAGPYRIGSSVEFDWGTMNMAWALKREGVEEIIVVNCNPETVSTDFDMSDRLYFEELSLERILTIYEKEKPLGVVVSVGGQIPNDLALDLSNNGVNVLGTSAESIERAEDRERFSFLLDKLRIPQPEWGSFRSMKRAREFCEKVGYPVIVRPSHVLSGSAMKVTWGSRELEKFLARAAEVNPNYPVTVSKFVENARELEVDAVSDGETTVIGAIIEHVQKAGVHSGDAIMTIPTISVSGAAKERVREYTRAIAKELGVRGPFNIQFLAVGDSVMVIECNLRASRSLPFVSKATGVNLIELAAPVILGGRLRTDVVDVPEPRQFAVKAPQFSFMQIEGAEPILGVEMHSTGEVACFGETLPEAMSKALIAAGQRIPSPGDSGIFLADETSDLARVRDVIRRFHEVSVQFVTTRTIKHELGVDYLKESSVDEMVNKISRGEIGFVLFLNTNIPKMRKDLFRVRRKAVELQVPFLSTIEEAEAVMLCMASPVIKAD